MPKIKYGARFTRERLILYTAIAVSFICIATCNATSSWLKKDWLKVSIFLYITLNFIYIDVRKIGQ